MRRRALLATFGTGLASLAGCSNTPSDGSTPTPPATNGGGTGTFEFVGVDIPERVQINETYRFRVTVRNTGDSERTFTSPLSARPAGGKWQQISQPVEVSVPAGETATWESPKAKQFFLGTYEFRLDALDARWSLEAVPRTVAFGTFYRTPTALGINVRGGKFESQFPPAGSDTSDGNTTTSTATSTATPTPVSAPDGETWLLVYVRMRNHRQSEQTTPAADTFTLHVGDETYTPQSLDPSADLYRGVSLGGRTLLEDPLLFAVPEGTSSSDVAVEWSQSYSQGEVTVSWQANV